jgi:hypothetical protein
VLGEDNPIIPKGQRNARHSYTYPNGAQILVAGLQASGVDQRQKIMSSSFDAVYVCESGELLETEWNKLTTRLRNGKMSTQFIWGDMNPDVPSHWIYTREAHGTLKILQGYHTDNPYLYDGVNWTEAGKAYMTKLSNLTGIDRIRLFEGKRGSTQGSVFGEVWLDAPDGNVTERAEYEEGNGPVYFFVDDGYAGQYDEQLQQFTPNSHPRVFLLAQVKHDGTICIFEESYKVQMLPERQIKLVEELGYPEPFRCVVDKSAVDLIGRLNEKYNATNQKIVDVEEGIKLLRNLIAPDENGIRRFLVHPRCRFLRFEFLSYKRDEKGKRIEQNDHGCLVAGTMVSADNGNKPIEDIIAGDRVLTRKGYRRVIASGVTDESATVFEVIFSNGNSIIGTSNHPVWVNGKGFLPIDSLRYGDIIEQITYRRVKCEFTENRPQRMLRELCSTVSSFADTLTRNVGVTRLTLSQEVLTSSRELEISIKRFGSLCMERFLTGMRFITKTGILATMTYPISNVSTQRNTIEYTPKFQDQKNGLPKIGPSLPGPLRVQNCGAKRQRALGCERKWGRKTFISLPTKWSIKNTFARFAERNMSRVALVAQNILSFAQTTANRNIGETAMLTTSTVCANGAEKHSEKTNTKGKDFAPVFVVAVTEPKGKRRVYNLTVDGSPEYYANGVLVHNCDAARYGVSVVASDTTPNFRVLG